VSLPSSKHTPTKPLRREPLYLCRLKDVADAMGGVAVAAAETFRRAQISVFVDGDVSALSRPGVGTLLLGDHRDKIEFAPLLALLGALGREDVHVVAKPFSWTARVIASLGQRSAGMVLPVVPGTLARCRIGIVNRDLAWRISQRRSLPTMQDLRRLNTESITQAARLVTAGSLVTLFPAGGVVNAARRQWRRGAGVIIKEVSPALRPEIQVLLFRFDDFSPMRLVRSLISQSHGLVPRPYAVTVRIAARGTIDDLLGGPGMVDVLEPDEIVGRLRRRFLDGIRMTADTRREVIGRGVPATW
jgi:hypothetical protein